LFSRIVQFKATKTLRISLVYLATSSRLSGQRDKTKARQRYVQSRQRGKVRRFNTAIVCEV